MSIRITTLIFLAACFCLFLLMAVLVAHNAFSGTHGDLFHTPQMIKHASNIALLI